MNAPGKRHVPRINAMSSHEKNGENVSGRLLALLEVTELVCFSVGTTPPRPRVSRVDEIVPRRTRRRILTGVVVRRCTKLVRERFRPLVASWRFRGALPRWTSARGAILGASSSQFSRPDFRLRHGHDRSKRGQNSVYKVKGSRVYLGAARSGAKNLTCIHLMACADRGRSATLSRSVQEDE